MGEVMVLGRLQLMGFIIRRERLRQTIRQVDPLHTALRWRGELTSRRPYSVPGPNSLWHMGKYIKERGPRYHASLAIIYIHGSKYKNAGTPSMHIARLLFLLGHLYHLLSFHRWSPQSWKVAFCDPLCH